MSRVAELLRADAELYEKKLADYGAPGSPFANFECSSAFAGAVSRKAIEPIDAALVLCGVKISRLQTVGLGTAKNEAVTDTLRDLRVYLALVEAMLEERG